MRLSCSHKRDEQMFDLFKEEVKHLHAMEDSGEIDLYSFDEMGVNLSPVVPYGWQVKGETHRLSSLPSKNHTVVGFVNRACKFHGFMGNGAATAETTIACMNEFAEELTKKTIVLIDNASIHKANIVMEQIPAWRKKNLYLQFIPAYCPELNFIERLWLEFKYRWLNKPDYFESAEQLATAIEEIVSGIGKKYLINFD